VTVKNDGKVAPSLSGADVREVSQPQLVGPICAEVTLHQILRRNRRETRGRRAARRALAHAFNAMSAHQALDRTPRCSNPIALQLLPRLPLPVDLKRLSVNTVNLAKDNLIMRRA